MENTSLFILDMDGLMFETGQLAYRSYLKAAKKHDFEVVPNVYYYLTGRNEEEIRQHMKILYGSEVPIIEWRNSINDYKSKILTDEKRVYKKKGLLDLLKFARDRNVKVAIASSSTRETINYYLKIEKLTDYIDMIVAGDEVFKSKPDPEIFLKACNKAGIAPDKAIVFEDSEVGIKAAQKAGIKTILIDDDITFLPSNDGSYKLKKDLSNLKETITYTDYKFMNLREAKYVLDYLIK